MKTKILITFLLFSSYGMAQNLTVPQEILDEMELDSIKVNDTLNLVFSVVKPQTAQSEAWPVALCLSGGNQAAAIVNYCYAAWFRTNKFPNYLLIIPHNLNGKNLRELSDEEIKLMVATIEENYTVKKNEWLIFGSSNGGLATFNFLNLDPGRYRGAVTMPGGMFELGPNEEWSHLNILLAIGTEDSEMWREEVLKTEKKLKRMIKGVKVFEMEDMPHILPLDYDIELVYQAFLDLESKSRN
jgi:predicted esterase